MRSADKREQSKQMFKSISAENLAQGAARPPRASPFYKDESGSDDEAVLGLRFRSRPFFDGGKCLQTAQDYFKVACPRSGCRQKLDRLLNGLNGN